MYTHLTRLHVLGAFAVGLVVSGLNAAPAITQQPVNVTVVSGQPATFQAAGSGTGTLRWQWRRLGTPIAGATSPTYTLAGATMANAGYVDVVLTDDTGSVVSAPARMLVTPVGGYANSLRLDPSFAPIFEGSGGTITNLVVAPDGSLFAAGNFSTIAGVPRNGLAHFNADLVPDSGFIPDLDGAVKTMTVQPNGKPVVFGGFLNAAGETAPRLLRLNGDGSIDSSFAPAVILNSLGSLASCAVQPDGKIVIGGYFNAPGKQTTSTIARLNADGSIDSTFGVNLWTDSDVTGVALSGDKVLIAGGFNSVAGIASKHLARLNADGSLDTSFAPVTNIDTVSAIAAGPNGTVYVGMHSSSGGTRAIIRLLADGTLDSSFNCTPPGQALSLTSMPDGRLAVACYAGTGDSRPKFLVLTSTGALDNAFSFPVGIANSGAGLGISTGNRVYIGAYSPDDVSPLKGGIVAFNSNGTLQASLPNLRFATSPNALLPVGSGKWLVGGLFTHINGQPQRYLARLNSDGTLDSTYSAAATITSLVYDLRSHGGGRVLVVGGKTGGIVQLLSDGTPDAAFAVGTGFGGYATPYRAEVLPDGRVVVASLYDQFSDYNGIPVSGGVVRLNANGSLDSSFQTTIKAYSLLVSLAATADGGVSLTTRGAFYEGEQGWPFYLYFVRLNAQGQRVLPNDSSGMAGNSIVTALGIDAQGRLLCGGEFSSMVGSVREGFARFASDTQLADSLNTMNGVCGSITVLLSQADNQVLVAGAQNWPFGQRPFPIVRLDTNDLRDPAFVACDVVTPPTLLQFTDNGSLLLAGAIARRDGQKRSGLVLLKREVAPLPQIAVQPGSATLPASQYVRLAAIAANAAGYQWYLGESGDTSHPITDAQQSWYNTPLLTAWSNKFWVRAANSTGSVDSATATFTVTGGTMTFADWSTQEDLPAEQRTPLAIPAGDGITNLMKFALGVAPLADATTHLPTATLYDQAGQPASLGLLFAKNTGAQGIDYILEISVDLQTWAVAPATTDYLLNNPDGTQLVRMRETTPTNTPRRFARLKVALQAP